MKKLRRVFGGDDNAKEAPAPEEPLQIRRIDDGSGAAAALSNQQAKESLNEHQAKVGGFSSIHRDANAIERSGVLEQFAKHDTSDVEKMDEYDRTLDDDAVIVQKEFSDMTPEQIGKLKEAMFEGEKGKEIDEDVKAALKKDHYGSELHKEYGATVEYLTGGILSAEEAMAMNPTGGIGGPGAMGIAFKDDQALRRHAIRHDATGFLKTHFGVGPGYGTKTTFFGLGADNPLAGQLGGIFREMGEASERIDTTGIGSSSRFGSAGGDTMKKRQG